MDTRMSAPGRMAGFTLPEVVARVTLGAVLLGIAIPSYQHLLADSTMSSARNSVMTHLLLARSEAIKRGISTVLCPSFDGQECLNGFEWQGGFMLFGDRNGNRTYDPGEPLLRFKQHDFGNIRVLTSTGRRRVVYKTDGSAAGYNATFTFCDETDQVPPRAILLSSTGRPRLSDTRANGDPLDCGG